jgi:hypothetical protein
MGYDKTAAKFVVLTDATNTSEVFTGTTGTLVANIEGSVSGNASTATNLSGTQTAKYIYAAPNGGNGAATFRALVASDIPTLNQSTTGNADTATTATNIAAGLVNQIPYQSAPGATTFDANLTYSSSTLSAPNVTSSNPPTLDNHLTTKSYVDGLSINVKASVKAATTANGALATAFAAGQLVDDVTLVIGDRILIKNQTTASENGIYVVTATAPTRASDFNSNGTYKGAFTFVEQGTVNVARGFVCTTTSTITFSGTDNAISNTSITFTQFSSAQLGSDSVTTAKIADGAVTTAKIADTAVTNAKIANATIDLTTKVTGVLPAANGGTGPFNTLSTSATLVVGNNLINAGSLTATLPAASLGAIMTIYSPSHAYTISDSTLSASISANKVTVCIGTGTGAIAADWAIYASGVVVTLE